MTTRSTTSSLRRLAAVVAMAALVLVGPHLVAAGEVAATPEAAVCEAPPIDAPRYAEAATDTSDDVPLPEPVPYRAAEGTPADAATEERVEAVVGQVVACVNEGRIAAFLSLFTSGFLERHAAELGGTPDDEPELVAADERLSLVRVADVTVLDNGRMAALVVIDQAEREAPELASVVTFAEVDGRLLIDGWQPVALSEGGDATPVSAGWEVVSGEGYEGVVVPVDRAPDVRFGMATEPSGYWLPDAGLIAELEAGLSGYLRSVDDERANALAGKVEAYARQYAGLVVDGRAVVYVNALCESTSDDGRWTSELVVVEDGGDCYFQVWWEPATGEFRELHINGEE